MNAIRRRFQPEQIRELVLVVLILGFSSFSVSIINYFSARTFNRISTSVAVIGVVAVGQTLVILTRNIDLSVGWIVGSTAYMVGTLLCNTNCRKHFFFFFFFFKQQKHNKNTTKCIAIIVEIGQGGAMMGI